MENKQTAVEWLYFMMNNIYRDNQETNKKLLNKAKEIEKEQIKDAWESGHLDYEILMHDNSQQYYNETYGK